MTIDDHIRQAIASGAAQAFNDLFLEVIDAMADFERTLADHLTTLDPAAVVMHNPPHE